MEKIENTFKDLMSALQMAKLYPGWHPECKKAVEKAYKSIIGVLEEEKELTIGIVGEELAFGKEIFFELSHLQKPLILYLKERAVEKIEFLPGLEAQELGKFIAFLVTPKEEIKYGVQESLSMMGVRNINAGKITGYTSAADAGSEETQGYLTIYENSLADITNSLDTVLSGGALDRLVLHNSLLKITDSLLGRYQDFLNFGTVKRYDSRTYLHTMNVSILSMFFSSKMGFSKLDVLDIGTAALFHDIGKLYISRKIINKPSRLTDEEFEKMKNHVVKGAEILLKYTGALGILPAVICFEHHLKFDKTGYPKVAFSQSPHLASLIVTICDVYDALSQRRSYKNDYPPNMIYQIMMKEKGTTFDPELLDKFFSIMGIWPIGSIVILNDGRVAVVRQENEDDIYCPKIEVIFPKENKEKIDLKVMKEKFNIDRFLNPFTDGKEYLPLV